MCENSNLSVSVCVVAFNEEEALPGLLEDIVAQDYPHGKIEVVLIDSCSTDKTKDIMLEFQKLHKDFWDVQVLDNRKKKQAAGWNVAIKNFKGDLISRIDAHSSIPSNFVTENVKLQSGGEYVTGGPRPSIVDQSTSWRETLLLAEQSMFGSGIAKYRRKGEKVYVNSLFHGTYKREVFEMCGGFDEALGRTEDNEVHYRIRQNGYRICFSPDIISYQHTRNSLAKMLKQKYGNGYWVALTLKACPKCLSIFHFVPLLFVFAIIGTGIISAMGYPILMVLMWSIYWFLAVFMSILAVKEKEKCVEQILLPFLFFLLHISYGVGSVVGLLKLPFWKYEQKNYLED